MAGAVINYHHDKLLTQLRSKNKNNDNANLSKEERYKIPVGCLFEFISCPNYFGEILEWFGFALMTSFGTPQVCFVGNFS
jgi:steroid 5-alpha reductase family enzyme